MQNEETNMQIRQKNNLFEIDIRLIGKPASIYNFFRTLDPETEIKPYQKSWACFKIKINHVIYNIFAECDEWYGKTSFIKEQAVIGCELSKENKEIIKNHCKTAGALFINCDEIDRESAEYSLDKILVNIPLEILAQKGKWLFHIWNEASWFSSWIPRDVVNEIGRSLIQLEKRDHPEILPFFQRKSIQADYSKEIIENKSVGFLSNRKIK